MWSYCSKSSAGVTSAAHSNEFSPVSSLVSEAARASRDTPPTRQRIIVAPRLTPYRIPKELLSSAPFRCPPSRQGKLKTQNQKPQSKNQTEARSHAPFQPHSNFKSASKIGASTNRREINSRSVNNPPVTKTETATKGQRARNMLCVLPAAHPGPDQMPLVHGKTPATKSRSYRQTASLQDRCATE